MLVQTVTGKDFGEVFFVGSGDEWAKNDGLVEALFKCILNLHENGCRKIVIDLGKIVRTDNQSSETFAQALWNNPHVKVAFYNIKPFVKHSLLMQNIDPKIFFINKEAALASFT